MNSNLGKKIKAIEYIRKEHRKNRKTRKIRTPQSLVEVTDIKTYNAGMKVSRRCHSLCHQRLLRIDNILFLEPIVTRTTSNLKTRIANTHMALSPIPGCGMLFGSANECQYIPGSSEMYACRMFVGQEQNRIRFPTSCPLIIQGLDVPPPKKVPPPFCM